MKRLFALARRRLGLAVGIGGGVALGNSLLPAAGRPALLAFTIPNPILRALVYFAVAFAASLLLLMAAEGLKGLFLRSFKEEGKGP
ncbi:MAG: hypothetical protein LBU47_04350 [Christensenellaceae bacterium]|jgi:hypothetical protein|nr:hypothetical protein [Christensenellaceae bacterium]